MCYPMLEQVGEILFVHAIGIYVRSVNTISYLKAYVIMKTLVLTFNWYELMACLI